jgi:hypothetical protein
MDNEIIEKIVKSSDKNKYNDFAYYIKIATGSNEPLMIHAVLLDILKRDDRGSDSQLFFKLTRDVLNYAKSNLGTNDYKDFLNMASGILAQRPLTDRMFILDKMIEADEMHIITEKSFTENLKPLRENLNIALANRKKITDNEKKRKK